MKNIIGEVVEIHKKYLETFELGKVVFNNNNFLIIEEYDPYGQYDGYIFELKSKNDKIVQKSKYLTFIKSILEVKKASITFDGIDSIILYAISHNKLLRIDSFKWKVDKMIKPLKLENDKLYYYVIDYSVKSSKEKCVSIKIISHIEIDSSELRSLERFISNDSNIKELKLLEIYIDDSNMFNVGSVKRNDKNFLIIKSYDPCGEYNGFIYQSKNIITKINSRTNYLELMKKVIIENESDFDFNDKYSIIEYAFNNKRLISISSNKQKYCYDIKINSFDYKYIDYQIISRLGKLGKERSIDIEKINYINIDSLALKSLEKIYK